MNSIDRFSKSQPTKDLYCVLVFDPENRCKGLTTIVTARAEEVVYHESIDDLRHAIGMNSVPAIFADYDEAYRYFMTEVEMLANEFPGYVYRLMNVVTGTYLHSLSSSNVIPL